MAQATEHYYLSADGLRLYYKDYETEAAGKLPVLCLPGLTRNSRDFEHVAPRLQRDRRVLCADLRGRGRSQHDPNWQNYHPGRTSRTSCCCSRTPASRGASCSAPRSAAFSR